MPQSLSREEQAHLEVGQTEVSPAVSWFLTIAFLLIIASVPLSQTALELREGRPLSLGKIRGLVTPPVDDSAGARLFPLSLLPTNTQISAFEDDLEDASFMAKHAMGPSSLLISYFLKGGNEQVYPGRHDWLFYRPGLEYLMQRGFVPVLPGPC